MIQQRAIVQVGGPKYFVHELPDFLTSEECDTIRAIATKQGMHKSEIYGATSDSVDNSSRLSYTAWLTTSKHALIGKISTFAAELTGYPENHQEDLQVLQYPEGGFFKPHYDCCDGGPDECKRMNAQGGPRRQTIIIYLNDDFQGGETFFPNINVTIVPQKGKAVVFWSTDSDNNVIRESFHGGNPVKGGEKWICNKWVHPKPY